MQLFFSLHSSITNLDFMEGSWKNSQDSAGPRLIKLPTSVGDKAKSCTTNVPNQLIPMQYRVLDYVLLC
jgi:hypothetical protein